jgi:salicylate hydroxylase
MNQAVEAIGEERAKNSVVWASIGFIPITIFIVEDQMLTRVSTTDGGRPTRSYIPINYGTVLNLVAFVTTDKDWPDYSRSMLPATREEAIKDFKGFGPNVMKLLEMVEPSLDIWGVFHLENELKAYNQDKIVVVGDAGHDTSPHHGAGAGFCIEDAAIIATILSDPVVTGEPRTIEAAFASYSAKRKLRTQWLVNHSRRQGDLYEWNVKDIGNDFSSIEQEITAANFYIEAMDVGELCDKVTKTLHDKLVK